MTLPVLDSQPTNPQKNNLEMAAVLRTPHGIRAEPCFRCWMSLLFC